VSPYEAWPFLSDPNHPLLSAVWAVAIHGVLALVAIAPILWRSRHRVIYGALAFVGGSVLDLDHVAAAGSLSLHALESLSGRPDTHSLIFVVALGLLAAALTRRPLAGWTVFAVMLSHLLFDGAGGHERILYPFARLDGLPWLLCPLGTLALAGVSLLVSGAGARPRPREPAERPDAVATA